MKFQYLIFQSKLILEKNSNISNQKLSINLFENGAKWMYEKLNENDIDNIIQFDYSKNYLAYGVFKYGSAFLFLFGSALLFLKINLFLLPLSIILFYFVEVHFLFLFPLLLDNVENPIIKSIEQTYKIGLFSAMIVVIPIGIYMVLGLLNFKAPLHNWYIGCLSIIIWYKNEIRNRL